MKQLVEYPFGRSKRGHDEKPVHQRTGKSLMSQLIRMPSLSSAWLFPGAIPVQVLFVGLSLFTAQAERSFLDE